MTAGHPAERPAARSRGPGPPESHVEDAVSALRSCADGLVLPHTVVEAVTRALAAILIAAEATPGEPGRPADRHPLLDVDEAARLLGVSRMTVTRMADEGLIPSVVVRRGKVQKTRRIPRAFVERVLADVTAGAHVDLEACTATWLAEHAQAGEIAMRDGRGQARHQTR